MDQTGQGVLNLSVHNIGWDFCECIGEGQRKGSPLPLPLTLPNGGHSF